MSEPLNIPIPAAVLDALAERVKEDLRAEVLDELASPWMTREEAAKYLRLPYSRLKKDRTVPCHRDGGRVLYFRPELDQHFLNLGRGR